MKQDIFGKLMAFLDKLEQAKISYTVSRHRDEALMVTVAVPGQRWEIEFLRDGSVEVERFASDGEIYGEEALEALLAEFSDCDPGQEIIQVSRKGELAPLADKR